MPARTPASSWILTPRRPRVPIARWLYDAVRSQILDGRLAAGARLPATRDLARAQGIARGSVVVAYEQLRAEGYLDAATGSGTYVARVLPDDLLEAGGTRGPTAPRPAAPRRRLSRFAGRLTTYSTWQPGRLKAFRTNVPALHLFPTALWAQIASRRLRRATPALLHGCEPAGHRPLRAALADYLAHSRGVACSPDRVLIVSGVQEALDLTIRIVIDRGDRVALEDPGNPGARYLCEAAGARIVPVPVDDEGPVLQPRRLAGVRLFYATPAHQFPVGPSMSVSRRVALLEWARRSGALVFEDDYDSEFRYSGRPVPALQGLDGDHHVIFAGSFSKVMFPSLRLGFLVVPPDLVDRFAAALSITHHHAPLLDQAVMADFLEGGHFARHVRRMRGVYAERLGVLTEAARRELDGMLQVSEVEAGLQTVGWLAPGFDADRVVAAARGREVDLVPLSRYGRVPGRPGLHLGFAAVEPRELRRGVAELAGILAAQRPRARMRKPAKPAG